MLYSTDCFWFIDEQEHDGKKRVALKPLPENCMDGESEKGR